MPTASHAAMISSADSSTKTPTGTAPPSFALAAISAATSNATLRLDLGQRIMPMKDAPAPTARSQSPGVVTPHTLTSVEPGDAAAARIAGARRHDARAAARRTAR
jgi:hypothetical protein